MSEGSYWLALEIIELPVIEATNAHSQKEFELAEQHFQNGGCRFRGALGSAAS